MTSRTANVVTAAGLVSLLAVVTLLRAPKLAVFFLGKGISFFAGVATVGVTFLSLRRLGEMRSEGAAAGLAVLVTAGPLALWAGSSLETVPPQHFENRASQILSA